MEHPCIPSEEPAPNPIHRLDQNKLPTIYIRLQTVRIPHYLLALILVDGGALGLVGALIDPLRDAHLLQLLIALAGRHPLALVVVVADFLFVIVAVVNIDVFALFLLHLVAHLLILAFLLGHLVTLFLVFIMALLLVVRVAVRLGHIFAVIILHLVTIRWPWHILALGLVRVRTLRLCVNTRANSVTQ